MASGGWELAGEGCSLYLAYAGSAEGEGLDVVGWSGVIRR